MKHTTNLGTESHGARLVGSHHRRLNSVIPSLISTPDTGRSLSRFGWLMASSLSILLVMTAGCKTPRKETRVVLPPTPPEARLKVLIAPPAPPRGPQTNVIPWIYPANRDAYDWKLQARNEWVGWAYADFKVVDGDMLVEATEPSQQFRLIGTPK